MGAETMKSDTAVFTKQCTWIVGSIACPKQVILHFRAKLKGFTEAEIGVTEGFSPSHFTQITPRHELTCCCAAYRCDLMSAQKAATAFDLD
jgi:hypothetical protein